MDARVKKIWVDALRSGEYSQGQHRLRTDDNFCCLGVLCELHSKENPDGQWYRKHTYYCGDRGAFYDGRVLPIPVQTWAGLDGPDPYLDLNSLTRASAFNDSGLDFNKMADLIEKML